MVDATGNPVVGAVVTAEPQYEDGPYAYPVPVHSHGQASSGTDGSFRIDGLGDCEYELRIEVPRGYAPPKPLRARGGEAGVVFRVSRSVHVTITVLDWRGDPRPKSGISVKHLGSVRPLLPPDLRTDVAGECRVGRVAPDRRGCRRLPAASTAGGRSRIERPIGAAWLALGVPCYARRVCTAPAWARSGAADGGKGGWGVLGRSA